jgi:hypothetical protein
MPIEFSESSLSKAIETHKRPYVFPQLKYEPPHAMLPKLDWGDKTKESDNGNPLFPPPHKGELFGV